MELNLRGKRALVCGASQGIGQAIASELAKEGVRILAVSRDEEKLSSARDSWMGSDHEIVPADLGNERDINKLVKMLADLPVDILINNAGGPPAGPIVQASTEDFTAAFSTHLFASHSLVKAVLPAMKEHGYGRIINVISTSVKIPIPGLGVSNTTRGAMASWSKTLSMELGPYGITVNNILPGAVDTQRLHSVIASSAKSSGITEEEAQDRMIRSIPAGRFGLPQELGYLAAFLASDKGAYINGVSIPVDGARTGAL